MPQMPAREAPTSAARSRADFTSLIVDRVGLSFMGYFPAGFSCSFDGAFLQSGDYVSRSTATQDAENVDRVSSHVTRLLALPVGSDHCVGSAGTITAR
jgi:hypothetical protein